MFNIPGSVKIIMWNFIKRLCSAKFKLRLKIVDGDQSCIML